MSNKAFNYIEVFTEDQCKAGFTLINSSYKHPVSKIDGLNLGFNNLEDKNVVKEIRDNFFESIGIHKDNITSLQQIHSNKVVNVSRSGIQLEQADACITDRRELCLLIQVADCTPILILDSKKNLIAAIHAGWRGAVGGIVKNTLNEMTKRGSSMQDLKVAIGPCIGVKKFEVGPEVADQFPAKFVDTTIGEKPHINLRAYIINQFNEMKISDSQITDIDICTVENIDTCYSHRRQGSKAGRMGAFISLI